MYCRVLVCDFDGTGPAAATWHPRWARDVLGDAELAAGLAKIEHTTRIGGQPSRDELIGHVRTRYVL